MRELWVATLVCLTGCKPEKECEELGTEQFRDSCVDDCDCAGDMLCFTDPGDDTESCCASSADELSNGWGVDCEISGVFGF